MENRLARRELETRFIILWTHSARREPESRAFNFATGLDGKLQSCDNSPLKAVSSVCLSARSVIGQGKAD
jgi:hypothetical protein